MSRDMITLTLKGNRGTGKTRYLDLLKASLRRWCIHYELAGEPGEEHSIAIDATQLKAALDRINV